MDLNLKLGLFGSDETALYKGLDAGKEMIEALASATRAVMQERWSRASEIGVTIDETTDRSVKSQMIIFYKYYMDGVLYEDCSGIEQLPNGKAQTVTATTCRSSKTRVWCSTPSASAMCAARVCCCCRKHRSS